jgi:hypothetical protein
MRHIKSNHQQPERVRPSCIQYELPSLSWHASKTGRMCWSGECVQQAIPSPLLRWVRVRVGARARDCTTSKKAPISFSRSGRQGLFYSKRDCSSGGATSTQGATRRADSSLSATTSFSKRPIIAYWFSIISSRLAIISSRVSISTSRFAIVTSASKVLLRVLVASSSVGVSPFLPASSEMPSSAPALLVEEAQLCDSLVACRKACASYDAFAGKPCCSRKLLDTCRTPCVPSGCCMKHMIVYPWSYYCTRNIINFLVCLCFRRCSKLSNVASSSTTFPSLLKKK